MKNILLIVVLFSFPILISAQVLKGTSQEQYVPAVTGINTTGFGVYGESKGAAVCGKNTGNWIGVYGESPNYHGVMGFSANATGTVGQSTKWFGVYGESAEFDGVRGYAKSREHAGVSGVGVNLGGYFKSEDPNGTAGLFDGNVRINGNLSVNNITLSSLLNRIERLENQLKNNVIPVGTRKTICTDMNNPDSTPIPEGWIRVGRVNSTDCQKRIGQEFNAFIIEKI